MAFHGTILHVSNVQLLIMNFIQCALNTLSQSPEKLRISKSWVWRDLQCSSRASPLAHLLEVGQFKSSASPFANGYWTLPSQSGISDLTPAAITNVYFHSNGLAFQIWHMSCHQVLQCQFSEFGHRMPWTAPRFHLCSKDLHRRQSVLGRAAGSSESSCICLTRLWSVCETVVKPAGETTLCCKQLNEAPSHICLVII